MKKLLALSLVALMAGTAVAQQPAVGMFFSNTDFTDENTNLNPAASTPFDAYLVMLGADFVSLGGYEVSITENSGGQLLVSGVTWPNEALNFGDTNLNHLVGYGVPLPVTDGAAVLCTFSMIHFSGGGLVEFTTGPATPQSIPDHDGPVFADNANVDDLIPGTSTGGAPIAVVATLYGDGIVAVEQSSLSQVKSLFQ